MNFQACVYAAACRAGDLATAKEAFLIDPEACKVIRKDRAILTYSHEVRAFILEHKDFTDAELLGARQVGLYGNEAAFRNYQAQCRLDDETIGEMAGNAVVMQNASVLKVLCAEGHLSQERIYALLTEACAQSLASLALVSLLSGSLNCAHWSALSQLHGAREVECAEAIFARHQALGIPVPGAEAMFYDVTVVSKMEPEMFDFYATRVPKFLEVRIVNGFLPLMNPELLFHLLKRGVKLDADAWAALQARTTDTAMAAIAYDAVPWRTNRIRGQTLMSLVECMAALRKGSCVEIFRALPSELRETVRQILVAARFMPSVVLSRMLDWVVVAYSRRIHDCSLTWMHTRCQLCLGIHLCSTCERCQLKICRSCDTPCE